MNYIVTAKPVSLPIRLDRPAMRPLSPVAEGAGGFRENRQQQPAGYIYRGELLETASDRAYRPRVNLQISPENRRAISAYHQVTDEPPVPGRIFDGYI